MTKPPAVALDHVSKWYGQVIGINDISIAIDGGVTGILGHEWRREINSLQTP